MQHPLDSLGGSDLCPEMRAGSWLLLGPDWVEGQLAGGTDSLSHVEISEAMLSEENECCG